MTNHNESFQITGSGLKYIIIYAIAVLLPFFFCLERTGMTCVVVKTIAYASQPLLLVSWLADLDFFHKYFPLLTGANIIINFFVLLWIGSLIERKNG